jgi:hypothetical protein
VAGKAEEAKKIVEEVASAFGRDSTEMKNMSNYIQSASSGAFKDKKGMDRLKEFGHLAAGNLEEAVTRGGFSGAWSMAGHHAIRGAVVGAGVGGTTSALNGGSFWDGAKSGAFKGAVGYTGLRMGAAATGAENWINPLAGGGRGMVSGAYDMYAMTGGKNVKVSKAAAKILAQRQGDGLVRGVMNINSSK